MARKISYQGELRADVEPGNLLFILFIPSRDSEEKALPPGTQEIWAKAAGDLLAELFGGATEMPPATGKWLNREKNAIITEAIVLVHSYVRASDAINKLKINKLASFLHKMGKETGQGEVAIVIDKVFYRIRQFILA